MRSAVAVEDIKKIIRDIPDFPKKGIIYKDITTLLKNPELLRYAVDEMIKSIDGVKVDIVVGVESRGFIFGSLIADKLNKGFAPVRKKGKLPAEKESMTYSLEYGEDTIEIHKDAISHGTRVLVVDDLLATGGTSKAVAELIEKLDGTVAAFSFLIELDFLHGRDQLSSYTVQSIVHY